MVVRNNFVFISPYFDNFCLFFFSYDSPNVEDRTITGIKFLEPEKKEETPKENQNK